LSRRSIARLSDIENITKHAGGKFMKNVWAQCERVKKVADSNCREVMAHNRTGNDSAKDVGIQNSE
jgi:hypothetical protein